MNTHKKIFSLMLLVCEECNLRKEELDHLRVSGKRKTVAIFGGDDEILRGEVNGFALAIGGEEGDDNEITSRAKRIKTETHGREFKL
jgi:hypothetical protein